MWHARNLCVKTVCVLYRSPENKLYFAQNGAFDSIMNLVESKTSDLQEVLKSMFNIAFLTAISIIDSIYI